MKKLNQIILLTGASMMMFCCLLQAEETSKTYGRFVLRTDPDNAYLPSSLELKSSPGTEILDPKTGLNLSFTDYEFRNKFYREENKYIWEKQKDPRFVVDVKDVQEPVPETSGDWKGESVSYQSSYANVKRSLLFHPTEPRMRIIYNLKTNREVLIHMPAMFGVGITTGKTLTNREILDERDPLASPLKTKSRHCNCGIFPSGPFVFSNDTDDFAVLITHKTSGDLPSPIPSRMIRLKPGKVIEISIELQCFVKNRDSLLKAMRAARNAMDKDAVAYRLLETGRHVLYQQKKEAEGEALLKKVADMKPDWYLPYMMIAEYRLQNKVNGVVRGTSRGQNYYEAAYRMPYNYGVILRGGDYLDDPRLTEEQQRLLLLNLLMAMENTLFYPNYYLGAARAFETKKMYAQACAMYRQALWAVDHYPVTEKKREKYRKQFKKKIADLEKKLLADITASPPVPIEVRPKKEGK